MLAGKVRESELQIPHVPIQPGMATRSCCPRQSSRNAVSCSRETRLISAKWRATEEDSQPPPLASMLRHAHATPPHTHHKNCVQRLEAGGCSTPRESNLLGVLIWGGVLVRLLPLSIMELLTNCTSFHFPLAPLISNCYMSPNTQRMRHFSDPTYFLSYDPLSIFPVRMWTCSLQAKTWPCIFS